MDKNSGKFDVDIQPNKDGDIYCSNVSIVGPEIPAEHVDHCRTGVIFAIPFGLEILPEVYSFKMPDSTRLYISHLPENSEFVDYSIKRIFRSSAFKINVPPNYPGLRIHPDIHGITCMSQITIFLNELLEGVGKKTAEEILDKCLPYVNRALDLYSLATREFGVKKISARDIQALQVFYYRIDNLYNQTHSIGYVFPSTSLHMPKFPSAERVKSIKDGLGLFDNLDANYTLAFSIFAESMRSFEADDLRLASIHAMNSLEAAIPHFIKQSIKVKRDKFGHARLSLSAYEDSKKTISMSYLMKSIFPLLAPDDVPFPKKDVDKCNDLRGRRNKAIHEPTEFKGTKKEILHELLAVERLLKFLATHHPGSSAVMDYVDPDEPIKKPQ